MGGRGGEIEIEIAIEVEIERHRERERERERDREIESNNMVKSEKNRVEQQPGLFSPSPRRSRSQSLARSISLPRASLITKIYQGAQVLVLTPNYSRHSTALK